MMYPDTLSSVTVVNNSAYEVRYKPAPSLPPRYIGYRVKHRVEPGARQTPNGMPEVDPSLNIVNIPFTEAMQLLSWEVMHTLNPTITKKQWRAVFGDNRAYTNDNGYGGNEILRDYVNGLNLDAVDASGKPALPKLMKGIIAGGAFVRGVMDTNFLTITPGVGAVDTRVALPSVQQVIDNHWYFVATTAKYNADGVWNVGNFPQGNGGPVAVVYFLNAPARYTASWFQSWDDGALPDPLKIYL